MDWSWLSFLIGLLVGWLIELLIDFLFWRRGRRIGQGTQVEWQAQLDEHRARVRELEDQLARCRANLRAREEEQKAAMAQLAEAQATTSSLQQVLRDNRAVEVFVPVAESEDLTRIEGIGPRIAEILNGVGILKYAQLASTPADRLHEILKEAGPRFRLANPASWPEQARLAGEGKWEQLQELQDGLSAGRASGETGPTQRPNEEKT
jgi:predicted flap endonuclease-1-like 5' DNA nuclease